MSFELEKIATDVERIAESMSEGGGGSGGILFVNLNTTTGALDKTWREIYDAPLAVVVMTYDDEEGFGWEHAPIIRTFAIEGTTYMVVAFLLGANCQFMTNSENGYPINPDLIEEPTSQ